MDFWESVGRTDERTDGRESIGPEDSRILETKNTRETHSIQLNTKNNIETQEEKYYTKHCYLFKLFVYLQYFGLHAARHQARTTYHYQVWLSNEQKFERRDKVPIQKRLGYQQVDNKIKPVAYTGKHTNTNIHTNPS